MTPGFSAVVGARYTHIFISAMGLLVVIKRFKKVLRHAALLGATCRWGEIPAIISPDEHTTADARLIE